MKHEQQTFCIKLKRYDYFDNSYLMDSHLLPMISYKNILFFK